MGTFVLAMGVGVILLTSVLPDAAGVSSTWVGDPNVAGDGSDPNNWSPGQEPTSADEVYIDNGGTVRVTETGEVYWLLYLGSGLGQSGFAELSSGGVFPVTGRTSGTVEPVASPRRAGRIPPQVILRWIPLPTS